MYITARSIRQRWYIEGTDQEYRMARAARPLRPPVPWLVFISRYTQQILNKRCWPEPARLKTLKNKRKSIDDLIDAFVWMARNPLPSTIPADSENKEAPQCARRGSEPGNLFGGRVPASAQVIIVKV
jgi:hypothetical protein